MADSKISALTDGVTALATDRIPAARSPFGVGDNVYLTPAELATYVASSGGSGISLGAAVALRAYTPV